MGTYEVIELDLDKATLTIHRNHLSEYTNYCELDGVWYKRSIVKLKHKPDLDD